MGVLKKRCLGKSAKRPGQSLVKFLENYLCRIPFLLYTFAGLECILTKEHAPSQVFFKDFNH